MKIILIYLLCGPDTYRSRRKLNEIIEEYRKKAGSDLSFHRFDAEEDDPVALARILEAPSLFSPRKLVVVENVFGNQSGSVILLKHLKKIKESCEVFLVIWERELDGEKAKRFKEVENSVDKIQEFKLLTGSLLTKWIAEEARGRGAKLSARDWIYLQSLGGNLWAVANELDKLCVAGKGGDGVVGRVKADINVFQLGDSFFTPLLECPMVLPRGHRSSSTYLPQGLMPCPVRNKVSNGARGQVTGFTARKRALRELLELINQGHDEHHVFSYLSSHTRSLLTIKHCLEKKTSIPGFCKIHPFVVKKTTPWLVSCSLLRLKDIFSRLLEEDYGIKIGLRSPKDALLRLLIH